MVLAPNTVAHLAESKNTYNSKYTQGLVSEIQAMLYYLNQDYCLRAHRFKTPVFEVDLIVENKNEVLLIEVKTVHSSEFNSFKITPTQKKRIRNGYVYLEQYFQKELGVRYVTVDRFNNVEDFEILF